MMKCDAQVHDITPESANPKPEVEIKIQDGGGRHIEFCIMCRHFVANFPIFAKFCKYMRLIMLQLNFKNRKCTSKFKMAAAAILDFRKIAVSQTIIDGF